MPDAARDGAGGDGAPIRVLQVVDKLAVGGVREVVLRICRELDPASFQVGLLTLAGDLDALDPGALPAHVTRLEARLADHEDYSVRAYLREAYLPGRARPRFAPALSIVEAFQPDVLHLHTLPRDLVLGILATRAVGSGPDLVFTDHLVRIRADDYSPWARAALRLAYRRLYRAYHVVSVGTAVEAANRAAGFLRPGGHHLLIENSVDTERFRPSGGSRSAQERGSAGQPASDADPPARAGGADPDLSPGTRPARDPSGPRIVCVARMHPVKGLGQLIRAFARAPEAAGAQLALVGPDEMGGALQKLAGEVVPPDRKVHFLGVRSDVPELLRQSTLGALPSEREGRPLALLEMMASGLPVVVTDIPELTGIVTDGHDGLVVPLGDIDALAGALGRLLADPELRVRLGRAARRTAVRESAGGMVEPLARLYRTLTPRD